MVSFFCISGEVYHIGFFRDIGHKVNKINLSSNLNDEQCCLFYSNENIWGKKLKCC